MLSCRRRAPRIGRGTVLVQVVFFGGVVGIGIASLAVDTGLMYSAKQELQSAADSAALAAASRLGMDPGAEALAISEGKAFANLNSIMGANADLVDADIVFGSTELVGGKYVFTPGGTPRDGVRVTLRRDANAADGPVSLTFAKVFGMEGAQLTASATAMLVPRDIAMVVDLSASMSDDSELRHYTTFASEKSGTIDGVQINLQAVWASLPVSSGKAGIKNGANPSSPGAAAAGDNQPGNYSGSPANQAGSGPSSGDAAGPRFGWMTAFGDEITLGEYDPKTDGGLYYIPYRENCTDADVIANLTEAGYSASERSVILSGASSENATTYRKRVRLCLGLAGWKSGKSGGKYTGTGDGDNTIEDGEMTQSVSYPYDSDSNWDTYINYMMGSLSGFSEYMITDPDLKYRYGLKTFTNYLMEYRESNDETPELANTPEEPLFSVKNGVQTLVDELIFLDSNDHLSLETFAQTAQHRMDLTIPEPGEELDTLLQGVADNCRLYQAGHDTLFTNIGGGMDKAIEELESERARGAANKVIILLTDGKPNIDSSDDYVGNNHADALSWCMDRADYAREHNMNVFTIGVGGDVDDELLTNMATDATHYYYADNAPDPDNDGQPMYVNQLKAIFKQIGGRRPIRLIQ